MFDMYRARALYAVAQHGSVAAAAESLSVTSSAISQQLAKLEREVGQNLLIRHGRGVALTPAGELLAGQVGQILERITAAETALEAFRGEVHGLLSMGAFATAARAIIPTATRKLSVDHPALRVESHEYEPVESLRLLRRGEIDIAILDDWSHERLLFPEGVESLMLGEDIADLAVPAVHPLADASNPIDLASCATDCWVSWKNGELAHDWLRSALSARNPDLRFAHTASEHQTILAFVDAGMGIALMPRLGRGPVPDGVILKTVTPPITRRYFATWRSGEAERPAIRAALEAIQAVQTSVSRPSPAN